MKEKIFFCLLLILLGISGNAQFSYWTTDNSVWNTDKPVYCMAVDSARHVVYLGGDFNYISPCLENISKIDSINHRANLSFPTINSGVNDIISDGSGGFYAGGFFSQSLMTSCNHLAHFDSNNIPHPVAGNLYFNRDVFSIDKFQQNLFVAGNFTFAGNYSNNAAVLNYADASKAQLTPSFNGSVLASISDGNGGWYVGGTFTQINNIPVKNLAHLNPYGQLLSFPETNGEVDYMAKDGNSLFIGGNFDSLSTSYRKGLAEIDVTTNLVTALTLNSNIHVSQYNGISYVLVDNNKLYISGNFDTISGQRRNGIARIDRITGLPDSWNPATTSAVDARTIVVDTNAIYIGGAFDSIGGQHRINIAAVDLINGNVLAWHPVSNGLVSVMMVIGNNLIAGGGFDHMNSIARKGFAIIDKNTAVLDPTDLSITCYNTTYPSITEFAMHNDTLFIGGNFITVYGQSRRHVAALKTTNWSLCSFSCNIQPNLPSIYTLAAGDSGIFIGGYFAGLGSDAKKYLFAINLGNDSLNPWHPDFDTVVNITAVLPPYLYVGGFFDSIDGQARHHIARFRLSDLTLDSWSPDINGPVYSITPYDSTVLVGGYYSLVNGVSHNSICGIDTLTGLTNNWSPSADSAVRTAVVHGDTIFIGGNFNTINSQQHVKIAAFDMNTGSVLPWQASCDRQVNSLQINGNRLYACGYFDTVSLSLRAKLAAFDLPSLSLSRWNPNANNRGSAQINARKLLFEGDSMIVAGGLIMIGGDVRNHVAAIDMITGKVLPWNPNLDGNVRTLKLYHDKIFIGGYFYHADSIQRNMVCAVDTSAGNLLPWNPSVTGTPGVSYVQTIDILDSIIYIGGKFNSIGAASRFDIGAVDMNSQVTSWNPGIAPLGPVDALLVTPGLVYVGGKFTYAGNQNRNNIAALYRSNGTTSPWDPNANNEVLCISQLSDKIYFGGKFTSVNNLSCNRLAAVDTITGTTRFNTPDVLGTVKSIEIHVPDIYVVGTFSVAGGNYRYRALNFDAITGDLKSWRFANPVSSASVNCLGIYQSKVLLGGDFQYFGNDCRLNLSEFETTDMSTLVTGTVYNDLNNDGIRQVNELPLPNVAVHVSPMNSNVYSNANGFYHVYCDTGTSVLNVVNQPFYNQFNPQNSQVSISTFGGIDSLHDFGVHTIPNVKELQVNLFPLAWAHPGFTNFENIVYSNDGTIMQSGSVTCYPDPNYSFVSAVPVPSFISTDSITWQFDTLDPGEHRTITLNMYLPSTVPLHVTLNSCVRIYPIVGDTFPMNNYGCYNQTTSGSYDPNNKLIYPQDSSITSNNTWLNYWINFQNTGTDTAHFVTLIDTLDPSLDLNTFTPVSYSHFCSYQINNRILRVDYNPIMLPDSGANQIGSHGYFSYKIKPDSAIIAPYHISNTAFIYFDFNVPVVTNTATIVIDTLSVFTSVNNSTTDYAKNISLFPVPASEELFYKLIDQKEQTYFIELYDSNGKLIYSEQNIRSPDGKIDLGNYANGSYFIKFNFTNYSEGYSFVIKR